MDLYFFFNLLRRPLFLEDVLNELDVVEAPPKRDGVAPSVPDAGAALPNPVLKGAVLVAGVPKADPVVDPNAFAVGVVPNVLGMPKAEGVVEPNNPLVPTGVPNALVVDLPGVPNPAVPPNNPLVVDGGAGVPKGAPVAALLVGWVFTSGDVD